MADKNILAYFHSPEEAEGAKSKLMALRAIDVSIDRFSRYPGDGNERIMNPVTGDFPGIGYLTQNADFADKNAAILAAANVDASGMSDGGQDAITGRDILLTAVVPADCYEASLRVVESCGGMI